MPIIPYRQLAAEGILLDPAAYELDNQSWSGGSNVRFDSQKAMRAPVWRSVYPGLSPAPAFTSGYTPSSGNDQVMIVCTDGTIQSFQNGTLTPVTQSGWATIGTSSAWNSTCLGDVVYINNPAITPQYYGPGSTTFQNIPAWTAGWYARSLRAFGDYLVAFNVTKLGVPGPNLVKWSTLTLYGQPPASWNANDQTTEAGENPLEGLTSPLVDGCILSNSMVIYSGDQVWLMQQTGTQEIFSFQQIFSEGGLIAPNCVVEVNGNHYVFGTNDIYMHDGSAKQSIATQRVRQFVYRNMLTSQSEKFFVHHMPQTTEIMFAFVSQDAQAYWQAPLAGCNRAVVYNYGNNTWAPIDLPGMVSMTRANVMQQLTLANATQQLQQIGGTLSDLGEGFQRQDIGVNQKIAPGVNGNQLLAYDFVDKGSLTYTPDPTCNAPAYIVKSGIDLDNVGSDLQTYKTVRRVFPQINIFDSTPVLVDIGSQLFPSAPLTYVPTVSFDPTQQYKVDLRKGGRYLSISFTVNELVDFEISGFDLDVFSAGKR